MVATLCGRVSGVKTARRATALRRWFTGRPERCLLGQRGRSLAQIPGNPLELVVTGRRRSGRPVAVFPCKTPRFASRGRSPHTREVAGSNPAAPTRQVPANRTFFARPGQMSQPAHNALSHSLSRCLGWSPKLAPVIYRLAAATSRVFNDAEEPQESESARIPPERRGCRRRAVCLQASGSSATRQARIDGAVSA
jgi:hypothetical protein